MLSDRLLKVPFLSQQHLFDFQHVITAPTQPSREPAQPEKHWMLHTQSGAPELRGHNKTALMLPGKPQCKVSVCQSHVMFEQRLRFQLGWRRVGQLYRLPQIHWCWLMKCTVLRFIHPWFPKFFTFHIKKPFYIFFLNLIFKKLSFPPNFTLLFQLYSINREKKRSGILS